MYSRIRFPSGHLLTVEQAIDLRMQMLGLATTADAGDCKTYAEYCPEVYRHGNCVIYIQLAAADFAHPSGAAYVRVTGMLLTHVSQLTSDNCCRRSVLQADKAIATDSQVL